MKKNVGLLMKITRAFDEKSWVFYGKTWVFDEKAKMSQHAVFWNSQSGKFQAQSLCGGP